MREIQRERTATCCFRPQMPQSGSPTWEAGTQPLGASLLLSRAGVIRKLEVELRLQPVILPWEAGIPSHDLTTCQWKRIWKEERGLFAEAELAGLERGQACMDANVSRGLGK